MSKRFILWRHKVVSRWDYIRRLDFIRTPLFGISLHRMLGPDPERDPHDHPAPFLSIVIRGGYTERRHVSWVHNDRCILTALYEVRTHRWFNWMPDPAKAHRIVSCEPGTITLMLWGRRCREWGFHTREGWVHHDDYKDA